MELTAEELGLATSPPYLSLAKSNNKNNVSLLDGVSFASAGAGIFDGTDDRFVSTTHFHFLIHYPISLFNIYIYIHIHM